MIIYILLLLAMIAFYFFAYFLIKDEKKNKFFCSLIPAFLIFVILGFKGASVGADSLTYVNAYNDIGKMAKFPDPAFFQELNNFNFKDEYGFIFLAYIFTSLNLPYLVFQIFVYGVICFSLFYSTLKLSKSPISSFIIFYCFTFFNFYVSGLRQSFAISLCLLAIAVIFRHKRDLPRTIIYFAIVMVATLWHKSAIIFIVPYFLINIKIGIRGFLVLIFMSVFLLIFGEQMYQFINDFSSMLFNKKVAEYAPYSAGSGLTNVFYIFMVLLSFFLSYPSGLKTKLALYLSNKFKFLKANDVDTYSIEIKKNNHLNNNYSFLLLMSFIGLWLRYTNSYSNAFGRIAMFFSIYIIFLIPNSIECINNKKMKNIVNGILGAAFVGYFIYTVVLTNYLAIAPYKFIEGTF